MYSDVPLGCSRPNCLPSLIATLDCQVALCDIITSTETKDLLQLTVLFLNKDVQLGYRGCHSRVVEGSILCCTANN